MFIALPKFYRRQCCLSSESLISAVPPESGLRVYYQQAFQSEEWKPLDHGRAYDCFGCINLHGKSYCILNKQYSKDEYFEILRRIHIHMQSTGELRMMLPAFVSGYAYNGGEGQSFLPLAAEEARRLGLGWDEETESAAATDFVETPANICTVADSILTQRIRCETSGKPFAIQRPELNFYRKLHIPVPTKGPLTRLMERGRILNLESLITG